MQRSNTTLSNDDIQRGTILWLPKAQKITQNTVPHSTIKHPTTTIPRWRSPTQRLRSHLTNWRHSQRFSQVLSWMSHFSSPSSPPTSHLSPPVWNESKTRPMNPGAYNHPILIISRPSSNPGTIYFVLMRGFRKRTLRQLAFKYCIMKNFLPIQPTEAHPWAYDEEYRTLELEGGMEMPRHQTSYASTCPIYSMRVEDARAFEAGSRWQLTEESFEQLWRHVYRNALKRGVAGILLVRQYDSCDGVEEEEAKEEVKEEESFEESLSAWLEVRYGRFA